MHEAVKERSSADILVRSKRRVFRRYFYAGSLLSVILLATILSLIHARALHQSSINKIEQLKATILEEKKKFLRNAVQRTIYYLESERAFITKKYPAKEFTDKELEALTFDKTAEFIRNMRLIDNGYVWINKVLHYEGGDDYALRLIHPNLPETEGMLLSTNATDIKGNRPYKIELDGINSKGEFFYDYYFKKMDSEEIAHKLSYAKLYKPYDWIIATGVYLDDVDALVAEEIEKMQRIHERQLLRTVFVSLSAVLVSVLILVLLEMLLRKMVLGYETAIGAYTHELEKISVTDDLTGLYNRRKLDEVFTYELSRSKRYNETFSIILIDLDFFKHVNDTYGHLIGDEVLREAAGLLRRNIRSTDTVGRWGGEEFLIICPETDRTVAGPLAEKLRSIIAEHEFQEVGRLTASFGVSTYTDFDDAVAMVRRADAALYKAKNKGRNQVDY